MAKLTFEKVEILKEIAKLKKEMKKFSKSTIIDVICDEIRDSIYRVSDEENYDCDLQKAFAFLIHTMEEKEKKHG